jgi:hypothetical protein
MTKRSPSLLSLGFGFLGLLMAVLGGWIAWHHPLGGALATLFFFVLLVAGVARYSLALIVVPAALPLIGLAPWSGWLSFEEFDLLIMALVSGSYLRLAIDPSGNQLERNRHDLSSFFAYLCFFVFALSVLIAMLRGFDDAGGFIFGWFQGYYEPMNSVRLAKSYFLALTLLPLWVYSHRKNPELTANLLSTGMAIGLGLASFAAVWERVAFPGFLNFSADYRTTALFWEMHVGGAAFDGFLALTVPFAFWLFTKSRTKPSMACVGGILAVAGYACLTTFSRGVYLGIPVGLIIMAVLSIRQNQPKHIVSLNKQTIISAITILVFFGLAAFWIFPKSGYRGMLALVISLALLQPVAKAFSNAAQKSAKLTLLSAIGIALLVSSVVGALPKGAYWVFALGTVSTALALWWKRGAVSNKKLLAVLSGYLSSLAGCVLIAMHWGGEAAVASMLVVVSVIGLAVLIGRTETVLHVTNGWHIGVVSAMLTMGLVIATFSGGAYMGGRFSTSGQDLEARIQHWKNGMALLGESDWWLGKGLGRYPATHFFSAPPAEHPGGYRLEVSGDRSYLSLSGGRHTNGWGEIFRVTQRISPGIAPYKIDFEVLADKPVQLHFEVCEKHLLYNGACVVKQVVIKGLTGEWQKVTSELAGNPPSRGEWYAPKLVAFSVAIETRGGSVKLDNLNLRDGVGTDLLNNGNFADGLAYWFSSSDSHHMPWHMKSMFFNTLFDQGLIGLAVLALMVFVAMFRLTAGGARSHPLAPVIAGSLSGFLVVGAFDSLIDVPRLAALFYFVLMVSLLIRMPVSNRQSRQRQQPDSSTQGT